VKHFIIKSEAKQVCSGLPLLGQKSGSLLPTSCFGGFLGFFFFLVVLELELRVLHLLDRSTTI
jgi:hypothetical protein